MDKIVQLCSAFLPVELNNGPRAEEWFSLVPKKARGNVAKKGKRAARSRRTAKAPENVVEMPKAAAA
jgi:hypothetical protein